MLLHNFSIKTVTKLRKITPTNLSFINELTKHFCTNHITTDSSSTTLETCSSVKELKNKHGNLITRGILHANSLGIATKLIKGYASFGNLDDALKVFHATHKPSPILWNLMIKEFCKANRYNDALELYYHMSIGGNARSDRFTYPSVLQACGALMLTEQGKRVHGFIIKTGMGCHLFVGASLVHMYVKLGFLDHARKVFDEMTEKDFVVWTALITGYVHNGLGNEALLLFSEMQKKNLMPNEVTLAQGITGCAQLGDLRTGEQVIGLVIKSGHERDIPIGNSLVGLFSKCGRISDARQVFDKIPDKDVVSWTSMMNAYAHNGFPKEVVQVFHSMLLSNVKPDSFTIALVLSACGDSKALHEGKWIHDYIVRTGFDCDVSILNALIVMYCKCGKVEMARKLFEGISHKDLFSWNVMVSGYVHNDKAEEAIRVFTQMKAVDVRPGPPVLLSMLCACSELKDLNRGKWIHVYAVKCGFERDVSMLNSLINMYAKCGELGTAWEIFDAMPQRDIVCWNAIIGGYAQNGQAKEAIRLFDQLTKTDLQVNIATVKRVLPACAQVGALEQAKSVHDYILRKGIQLDVTIFTSLVDMYAKCGNLHIARHLFDNISIKDVACWNAIVSGYGSRGYGQEALLLFQRMQQSGVLPNDVSFVCALSACSRAGLVEEGWKYFDSMVKEFGISPTLRHYTCMVDLLGRAGRLQEAADLIEKIPSEPDDAVWVALLGACNTHGNVELAERAVEHLFYLNPDNYGYYVIMSNIYAKAGRRNDVARIRDLMKKHNFRKTATCDVTETGHESCPSLVEEKTASLV